MKMFLILSLILTFISLHSKDLVSSQEDLDAAFIFLIAKNTTWPNEKKFKNFHIAILDEKSTSLKAFQKLTKNLTLKNKTILLTQVNLQEFQKNYKDFQIIFVSKKYKNKLSFILHSFPKDFPLLIISKECDETDDYMINLYENKFHKINIQINLKQLYQHNLTVSNEIILSGGKQVGISKLFESSIQELKKQEKSYKKFVQQNMHLKKEILKYKTNIKNLQDTMKVLKDEISYTNTKLYNKLEKIQKKDTELTKVIDSLQKEKLKLLKQQEKLNKLTQEYKILKETLHLQKKSISEQKQLLQTKETMVLKKQDAIKVLDKKLEQQHKLLNDQVQTIEQQGTILYLLIVILILIILFTIYFYRTKNKYKILSDELIIAKENADHANHSKSIFLANMSHELRTPLNAILGFSQLLSKENTLSKTDKKTVSSIYRAGTFLLSLINDVLDLSRIEAGKLILHEEPTNIKKMIADIYAFVKADAEKKGIHILINMDRNVPSCVFLDGDKLRQIVLNYLTNAIKYSNKGTVKLSIKADQTTLYLSVKDEGDGIKKEEFQKIFKPFIQVGKASDHTGTGLGLAITQKYAKSMGGDVSVQSQYKKGSIFYADVLYHHCDDKTLEEKENLNEVIGIVAKQNLKILIVDDKEDNRELLKAILKQDKFEIILAKNGYEAIEMFQTFHPDIIWMDTKMPILDGEEAILKIRKLETQRKVIIVSITANAYNGDKHKLHKKGIDEFLLKPYSVEKIYAIMHKYFQVEYIYKNEEELQTAQIDFSHEKFTQELEKLNHEQLQELHKLALLLDKEEIEKSIKSIEKEHPALAQMLFYLVDELQYNIIIKATL